MMDTNMTEMPKYQCHKQVWALKIKSVEPNTEKSYKLIVEEEGYAPVIVGQRFVKKHDPQPGGYYVVYRDGYKSYSPADAFEEGYTKI